MFKHLLKTRAFVQYMQTKTLLFKGLFIGCSRMYEQDSSYRKYIVQCSLEYTLVSLEYSMRSITIVVAVAVDVIVLEQCKSFVAYVVDGFVLNFVELFVVVFVSILVISSCKEPCNTPCIVCCKNTLVGCAYCYESVFKNIS